MIINSVQIVNFRCFESQVIDLGVPTGEPGSGLNILIGENGTGKTTVLESLNYLTQSSYAAENRLGIQDFRSHSNPIAITGTTKEFTCKMSAPHYGQTFRSSGLSFRASSRTRKASGRLLSSPFQISTTFIPVSDTYTTRAGKDSGKAIPGLQKVFSNSSIEGNELNIFYFDKNRGRQLSSGTYKTMFERICDDLNWKYLKAVDKNAEKKILESSSEYFDETIQLAQKHIGEKLASQVQSFFGNTLFKNLRIELANILNPFSNAFLAIRQPESLGQIPVKGLGSGVEMVVTLLLLLDWAKESSSELVILIDEPELHLHPRAQKALMDLLLEESATNQILVSTHSPYLFRGLPSSTALYVFRKSENDQVIIQAAHDTSWGIFPWSPSWGEVNFFAYDLPTVEFHNELYGFLQERSKTRGEKDFEDFLSAKSIPKVKAWLRDDQNGEPYSVSLPTYVRNTIHHPEN